MNESRLTSSTQFKIKKHQQTFLVALLFLFLTIVATWPVLTNLETVIVGLDNDVYINPWADWWTLKALQEPKLDFWQTDYLYYPHGVNLSYHSFSHLNTLVSLALRPLVGVLPGYNLAILLNYFLAGIAMFQLARYTTGSAAAGILAGIVFAFNSHNLYQSAHPVLVSVWCFPWATLYFLRAVQEDRLKWAVITAVFVFLGAATSTILLILMGLWLAGLTLYLFLSPVWPRPSWRIVLTAGFLSLLFTLPLIFPLLREAVVYNNDNFLIDPQIAIVTDISSPFTPHWYIWLKRGLYFGIVPTILILLAIIRHKKESRLWLLLLIGAYLLAIGPYPLLFGNPLNITLPWSLPITPVLRNPYRINILLSLGLAVLVAYGWVVLVPWLKNRNIRYGIFVLLAGLIYGEYTAVTFPYTPITVSPFYTEFLEDVPDDVALAVLPTGRQEDKLYLYYQTLHGHKITGGTVSRASAEVFDFIQNNALLQAGAVDGGDLPQAPEILNIADVMNQLRPLSEAGIGYIIIHKQLVNEGLITMWQDWLTFAPHYEDDEVVVYRTDPRFGQDFAWEHPLTNNVGLIQASFSPAAAVQSGTVKVDARWGTAAAPDTAYDVCFQFANAAGHIAETNCQPIAPSWPSARWQADEVVRSFYVLPVVASLAPGSYLLSLRLAESETGEMVGETAVLGPLTIHSSQPQFPSHITWDNQISLTGFNLHQTDDSLTVTFFWQARQAMESSYKLFVHLIDPATGQPVVQSDVIPRGWTYPTNIWEPGELVRDELTLALSGVPTGVYELWLGFYDEATGQRLPVATPDSLPIQNEAVRLTTINH